MSAKSHIAIKGDLTMSHVADAMKRISAMPKKREIVIDLSGAKEVDSSAVALLLNSLSLARTRGSTIHFESVPDSILTLADIYGLKSVIAEATVAA